jgi:L-fuculose-phosphate aldolase
VNHLPERELICEIGRRLYAREFVAAHEGNLSIRLSDGNVLCTPTMHCKGFLQPDQLCIIDIDGQQIDDDKSVTKPTSEMRLHLEIYRQRSDVNAVVHSHPNHATAFAVAQRPFPPCYLAEPDLFLGEIALAAFETPGTEAFAKSITPYVKKTNAVLLANHGLVTYGADLEKALWMTEVLESACKTLILSMAIGGPKRLSAEQGRALAQKRANFGFHDPRDLSDPNLDPSQHPLFKKQLEDDGFGIDWFDRRDNG